MSESIRNVFDAYQRGQWLFLILVPLAIIAGLIVLTKVMESQKKRKRWNNFIIPAPASQRAILLPPMCELYNK